MLVYFINCGNLNKINSIILNSDIYTMFKVNIVLRGRVQGVGFRYYAKKCADEMKVFGHVWNNYDGSVEIIGYLETKKDIEEFVEKIKRGPEMSSVKEANVIIVPSDPPIEESFEMDN